MVGSFHGKAHEKGGLGVARGDLGNQHHWLGLGSELTLISSPAAQKFRGEAVNTRHFRGEGHSCNFPAMFTGCQNT